ncbi:toxin co-regulated pilus biosynthesis Q family protein [Paraburkholderia mimosarum]|uniref:toxin co-regulated pilus biosynthesis Q family protein n=2 Tax=Paraburkholderia mimosarum TaxID=312026 RepID=UPI0004801B6B|nr:toxin co-regulated pilus biosynthesis Q family protein [Paraburkholderia mimosarum]
MRNHFPKDSGPRVRTIVQALLALALGSAVSMAVAAMQPDQSKVPAPAGDGWQLLGSGSAPSAPAAPSAASTGAAAPAQQPAAAPVSSQAPAAPTVLASAAPITPATPQASAQVSPDAMTVVVPPAAAGGEPVGTMSFTITPQDTNLRNALDRWLQTQGWQLAWKIGDDLPVEFNATFSGDFRSVLTQVMQATDHMRTPSRVCEHTNNVIRVIARAANCKD